MAYTEEQLREALIASYRDQMADDSSSALDWLMDIFLDGYSRKGLNDMTLEELEAVAKDEGMCTCTKPIKDKKNNCTDCGSPITFAAFIALWE